MILQACNDERRCREAARRQRRAESVNRRRIGREQQRAVEDDRHDGLAGIKRSGKPVEIDRAFARQIAGVPRDELGFLRLEIEAGMAGEPPQQRAQVFAAAFAEVMQQRAELRRRQCRSGGEPCVVAVFARQHGERDAAFARQRRQSVDAVFPPIETAEQAHHDHLGVRADAIDPQIDRHRMAQVAQMREANARQRGALGLPRGGEPGEIAVGERQDRDIAWRLAEIDRFDDVVEVGCGRRQQVHGLKPPCYPMSACATAARSSPLSPITTKRPSRVSSIAQGRSY